MAGTPRSSSRHEGGSSPDVVRLPLGPPPVPRCAGLHIYTAAGERSAYRQSGRGRSHAPGGPVRILIVEDDLLIALDIEMTLEEAGHHVVATATTARGAVDAAAEHTPDLVLMDLRLADGSWGGDAAREIRDRLQTAIVFLSGNLDPATRERLLPLDPVAMLSKPFLPGQLLKAVAAAA